ncbi:MAG: leucyl/phenylalanyl-tRNA--protein transferase [Spirochaetota bacterium]
MISDFPYLSEDIFFQFPPIENATPEGIVAMGGNLSPGMLLSAYRQGIFPWYSGGEPILWWSPDPRFILFPEKLHIPASLEKILKRKVFTFTADKDFSSVIKGCRNARRKDQPGTWITREMLKAYIHLHELGYAHSVEAWQNRRLAGGLYGVSLGSCFFGESMFTRVSNASKAAFVEFVRKSASLGIKLIDCQVFTGHLKRFGAEMTPRENFLKLLQVRLKCPTQKGNWSGLF